MQQKFDRMQRYSSNYQRIRPLSIINHYQDPNKHSQALPLYLVTSTVVFCTRLKQWNCLVVAILMVISL